ncbi:MAG: ribonuclease H-like domain-containing protein [Thermoplasmata archaeon]|nr:ribonuclease H-like domain-containing protein [Thermoplasmata archaeon]
MLRSTFQHLHGVGPWTEAEFWRAGLSSWEEFERRRTIDGVSAERKSRWDRELALGAEALARRSAGFFAERLPPAEHWRLYPEFRRETAFLDIETTSLSPYEGIVTVVAVHGGGATRSFIAGDTLEELPAYLRRFPVLATFNGIFFDVPFLRVAFPHWVPPPAHIDLRFVLRRLGYTGGLKRIEQQLQIGDRVGVEGIHGLDAVRLWQEFRRGKSASLELLVDYNRADTVNLEPLLEFAVTELTRRLQPLVRREPLETFAAPSLSASPER